jgi:hypothetical protein
MKLFSSSDIYTRFKLIIVKLNSKQSEYANHRDYRCEDTEYIVYNI